MLDDDKSGYLEVNEFREIMNSINSGFTENDIEKMINMADIDGDG